MITGQRLLLRRGAAVLLCVSVLSVMAYWRSLQLPLIADDYQQIQLARDYGPLSGWAALAHDALYRCRATSLILTYWTERWFGINVLAFNVSSLLLHILNGALVFALGMWKPIGWRVSAVSACCFAVSQRHNEAVIWYAAVPELLVFAFSILSFLSWVSWLNSEDRRWIWYSATLAAYALALLSKESAVAVVPLLALALIVERRRDPAGWIGLVPFALLAGAYFVMSWSAKATHLHYNDGTFSPSVHVVPVLLRSVGHLLWFWRVPALIGLLLWSGRRCGQMLAIALAWIVATLLPYSFLAYMPEVPSRHTYFASAGSALILGAAGVELWRRLHGRRQWIAAAVALVFVMHQCGYIWVRKHHQYAMRAEPTERLVEIASKAVGPVRVSCFPYWSGIAQMAVEMRVKSPRPELIIGQDGVDLCNAVTGRRVEAAQR